MLHIEGTQTEGENEGLSIEPCETSSSNSLSLKAFIHNEFQNETLSDEIYSKLIQHDIKELDILIFSDDNDLNKLYNELNLSLGNTMKFKALIRRLKNKNASSPNSNIVPITTKEQNEINKIESALKKSNNIYQLLEQHYNEIDQQSILSKSEINVQFEYLIDSLQKRQKALNNKIDEWKLNKLETINAQIAKIIKYNNSLTKLLNDIDDLLKDNKTVSAERTKQIIQITTDFCDNDETFNQFNDNQLLKSYIESNTKLFGVKYQKNMSINTLNEYGMISENINNNTFAFPCISLKDIIKMKQNDKGFHIKLRWDMISKQAEEKKNDNMSDFVIKYLYDTDNDEKKETIGNVENKWFVLKDAEIKLFVKNKFSAEIKSIFELNKLYKFKVEKLIRKPVETIIISNVKEFICKKQVINVEKIDMNNMRCLSLTIHSHKGHYGDNYRPENVLTADNNYYCSLKGIVSNDWIIFRVIKSNIYYYPIKIKIRAWDGNASVKQFGFCIGNHENNEWTSCHKQLFTSDRSKGKQWQEFELDVMKNINSNNGSNEILENIYKNKYKDFKLHLCNNYGNANYVGLYEFKLYGVELRK